MTDLEIYVDGYVSANIQNLNAGLEATRQMLKRSMQQMKTICT